METKGGGAIHDEEKERRGGGNARRNVARSRWVNMWPPLRDESGRVTNNLM